MDISILSFLIFALAYFFLVTCPAFVLLKPVKLRFLEKLVIANSLGISLVAISGMVFGYIGLRSISYFYYLLFFILFLFFYKKEILNFKLENLKFRIDYLSVFIVALGTISMLSAVWFMGVYTDKGLFFCCRGVPDAIYHLSLTKELVDNFPPQEPGMRGVYVQNYHYFSNLVVAEFSRLFRLNFISVQFRYLSVVLAVALGLSPFVLSAIIGAGKNYARWLALFLYGSGDILYLLLFLRGKGITFNLTIIDDASKLLAGPPRAFSVVLLLGGICLISYWVKRKNWYTGALIGIILGSLLGFKIYTGIFAIIGILTLTVFSLFKKNYITLVPFFVTALLSSTYYILVNKNAGGLVFNGMWRFENFILNDNLNISKLEYMRLTALSAKNYLEVFGLEILFVIIYYIFLFGTLNIAFFQTKKSLKFLPVEVHVFLVAGISFSVLAGSFFVQKTGGANTIQFLINAFIFLSFYSALAVSYFNRNLKGFLKYIFILTIVLFTLPRVANETLANFKYINFKTNGVLVQNTDLESFRYIKNNLTEKSTVAFDPWMSEDESFMYASFLGNREVYLAGAGVLRDHGQNTTEREIVVKNIFETPNNDTLKKLMTRNGIDYLYVSKGSSLNIMKLPNSLNVIFDNGSAKILKIN